jgi:hypothetical protein
VALKIQQNSILHLKHISEQENYEDMLIRCQGQNIYIWLAITKIMMARKLIHIQESGVQGKTGWHVFPAPCMQEIGLVLDTPRRTGYGRSRGGTPFIGVSAF